MPLYTFRFCPRSYADDDTKRTITSVGISWESAEQAAIAILRLNLNRDPAKYRIERVGEPKALSE